MVKSNGKKFIELLDKRKALKGTQIFGFLNHLATSLYIVNRNHKELSNAILVYEKDVSIWDVKNRVKLDAFMREFSRLLHNYLTSVYSLIQHTINLRKKLGNSELSKEYSERLKSLHRSGCVKFVINLRQYSQHFNLPFVSAQISLKREREEDSTTIKQQILLEKNELLKWKSWGSASRKYISSRKEIDMKPILIEYQTLNKEFYRWYFLKIKTLYSKELQEFFDLESELTKLSP